MYYQFHFLLLNNTSNFHTQMYHGLDNKHIHLTAFPFCNTYCYIFSNKVQNL